MCDMNLLGLKWIQRVYAYFRIDLLLWYFLLVSHRTINSNDTFGIFFREKINIIDLHQLTNINIIIINKVNHKIVQKAWNISLWIYFKSKTKMSIGS